MHTFALTGKYAYYPPESNAAVKDKDDTWCRPQCSPGEGYAAQPIAYPNMADECVPCPRNFYQAALYPHKRTCNACSLGKFTSSAGASNPNSCTMPQVIPYRSTHRVWYFFGAELKANTDCMQTFIGTRGLASNKGVAAIRDQEYSPMCDVTKANFATTYWDNKLMEDFTWNKYPLELSPPSGGNFLLFGALPGQTIDATFTSYKQGQSIEILNTKGGPLDQETFCGCLDYAVFLPSTCNITMVLTIGNADDSAETLAVSTPMVPITAATRFATTLDHSFGSRDGSLNRTTGYNDDYLYVSAAPFVTYTCENNSALHLAGMIALQPIVHTPNTDASCAQACGSNDYMHCAAYVFSGTNCSLFFPNNWVPPSGTTTSTATALPTESVYCKKSVRASQITDQSIRYSLSMAFDTVTTLGATTAAKAVRTGSTKALMRACPKSQLACQDCTKNDIMRNLNADLAILTNMLLQTDSGNTTKTLGCALTKDNQFEDCVPPDVDILSDIDKGYYFHTDMTGTPGQFETYQARGRNLFRWTDYSLCEQAFTLTRKWKALAAEAWSTQDSFTAGDLAVHGGSACDEVVVATTHFDDLTDSLGLFPTPDEADQKRPLGSYHQYCVRERRGAAVHAA